MLEAKKWRKIEGYFIKMMVTFEKRSKKSANIVRLSYVFHAFFSVWGAIFFSPDTNESFIYSPDYKQQKENYCQLYIKPLLNEGNTEKRSIGSILAPMSTVWTAKNWQDISANPYIISSLIYLRNLYKCLNWKGNIYSSSAICKSFSSFYRPVLPSQYSFFSWLFLSKCNDIFYHFFTANPCLLQNNRNKYANSKFSLLA